MSEQTQTRSRPAIDLGVTAPSPQPAAVPAPEPAGWYPRVGKPAIDRVIAVGALLLLAPLLLLLALTVVASVGRPVIYRQTRVGRGGTPFEVLKFRTMHADRRGACPGWVGDDRRCTHKSPDDPRLTRAGRVMRALSLDELPQLLNVVRGEMSLVGPRPEMPEVIARHYLPHHHRRHVVRPGMTGLWQITCRGDGMMHEHVDVDLAYIDRLGPLEDLRILLCTVPAALLSRRGS